jgi:hypothetical protein
VIYWWLTADCLCVTLFFFNIFQLLVLQAVVFFVAFDVVVVVVVCWGVQSEGEVNY